MVGELLALRVRVIEVPLGVKLVLEEMVLGLNIVVIAEVAVFVGVKYVFVGVKLLLGAMVVRLKMVVIAEVELFPVKIVGIVADVVR